MPSKDKTKTAAELFACGVGCRTPRLPRGWHIWAARNPQHHGRLGPALQDLLVSRRAVCASHGRLVERERASPFLFLPSALHLNYYHPPSLVRRSASPRRYGPCPPSLPGDRFPVIAVSVVVVGRVFSLTITPHFHALSCSLHDASSLFAPSGASSCLDSPPATQDRGVGSLSQQITGFQSWGQARRPGASAGSQEKGLCGVGTQW